MRRFPVAFLSGMALAAGAWGADSAPIRSAQPIVLPAGANVAPGTQTTTVSTQIKTRQGDLVQTTTYDPLSGSITTTTQMVMVVKVPDPLPENKLGYTLETTITTIDTSSRNTPGTTLGSSVTADTTATGTAKAAPTDDTDCPECAKLRSFDQVKWASSIEMARDDAAKHQAPYAVFICDDLMWPLVGEGAAQRQAYKLQHSGVVPDLTVFDYPALVGGFTHAGVSIFVKVPKNMAREFEAPVNSLLLFAPDGQKLDSKLGSDCTPASVTALLEGLSEKWKRWQEQRKR